MQNTHPPTRREDLVETIQGQRISDPYRWLENKDAPEVRRWVEGQNDFFESKVAEGPLYDELLAEMDKTIRLSLDFLPWVRSGKQFFLRRPRECDQPQIWLRAEGKERLVIDPMDLDAHGLLSIDYWAPSPDGRLLIYGVSHRGSEDSVLCIRDVESGHDLPERIERARHSQPRWLPDNSGFYYQKLLPRGTVPVGEESYHMRVYFHALGTDGQADPVIFGAERPITDMYGLHLSADGRWLSISAGSDWKRTAVYILDRKNPERGIRPLIDGPVALFSPEVVADRIYLQTNFEAPKGRILYAPVENPPADVRDWEVFVAESEDALEEVQFARDGIALTYLHKASNRLELIDYAGRHIPVALPGLVSILVSADSDEDGFWMSVTSFAMPPSIFRLDMTGTMQAISTPSMPFEASDYTVRQVWFPSKDGTSIPAFIVEKKTAKTEGPRPTLLTAYGGFGISRTPGYEGNVIAFLNRGGVYVVANIRGGGEFGEAWHQAGVYPHKQTSFDDFVSAAKYLIASGLTDSEHLAIRGGSNGGLLVCAAMTQAPELFRAVVAQVALTDMVRFPLFLMASRWTAEYGDPGKAHDLADIMQWSPYHRVDVGQTYPDTLFATALEDSRVHPMHSWKMGAALQHAFGGDTFIATSMDAGHAGGKPLSRTVVEMAQQMTFLWQRIGIAPI